VTAAWNHGGSRPRAVLLCSLVAWSSAANGGSVRPRVVLAHLAAGGLHEVRRLVLLLPWRDLRVVDLRGGEVVHGG
jgi:hypothetical protein